MTDSARIWSWILRASSQRGRLYGLGGDVNALRFHRLNRLIDALHVEYRRIS